MADYGRDPEIENLHDITHDIEDRIVSRDVEVEERLTKLEEQIELNAKMGAILLQMNLDLTAQVEALIHLVVTPENHEKFEAHMKTVSTNLLEILAKHGMAEPSGEQPS